MRTWNGAGYKAIVMTSNPADTNSTAANICRRIGMSYLGDSGSSESFVETILASVATPDDIEIAGNLLRSVILGMAHWLQFRSLPSVLNIGNDTE
jgi:hypothetical protein